MSLRTRIKGTTAWINLRISPYDHLMNNVVMDLLSGTNMKMLMHSLTGREFKKIQNLDGLTQQQKITRVEWALEELKKYKVIPEDVEIDSRLFAMRSAEHIFTLLWRLIQSDILFVWERAEFLQHDSDEILCEVPFKWIPEPPPSAKKKAKAKTKKSLLSGFGASSIINESIEEDEPETTEATTVLDSPNYEPFPRHDYMKKFKIEAQESVVSGHKPKKSKSIVNFPTAEQCIMEFVNKQLNTVSEGRRLHCLSIDDLVDSRVLCALVNSFVPNTFTTEVLLNDRWTINLVLRTAEKMFYIDTPFDSEDLVEADSMSVCSYFCVFFMLAYKYRQSMAVVNRRESLKRASREMENEYNQYGLQINNVNAVNRRKQLKDEMESIQSMIERLESKFDMEFCYKWMEHVQEVWRETHQLIRLRVRDRFDIVQAPRSITINDLCLSMVINLSLTNGTGFYQADGKETITDGRKLVLREIETGEFIEDFTQSNKQVKNEGIKKLLHLPNKTAIDIDTNDFPKYEFFFEAPSRNKLLRTGTNFLYQCFPGNTLTWQKVFLKAVKDNEFETVERMVIFFRTHLSFINCREPQTGNSPLHVACRYGHFDIALYLLENGANIDQKNQYRQTPLFSAIEGLQRDTSFLLIEWGCDIHIKGPRGMTAFETVKNDELRDFLLRTYEHYSTIVPRIISGDTDLLLDVVNSHYSGFKKLGSPRSRCVNGSTLLHTAAYFNCVPVMQILLKQRLDINLLDYKGATPLHRAKDINTMKILLDAGAKVSVEDSEGNTPLHVKCYGEAGHGSEMAAIQMLLEQGAKLTCRNNRSLMPIHCCAMQGRVDVIHALLSRDEAGDIRKELASEKSKTPPSLVHLAVANDFVECAQWLIDSGFDFKEGEQDLLMRRILTEQIKISDKADSVRFLLEQGASPTPHYPGGNTALHYSSSALGNTDVLETLVAFGADLDAPNDELASPLFFACQSNNQFAASILISRGANVRARNLQGLTAFDFIMDYDEWIECGYFGDEIRARLKAYSLKHARDLIRAISKKVKAPQGGFMAAGVRGQVSVDSKTASSPMPMLPPPPAPTARSNYSIKASVRSQPQQKMLALPPLSH